MTNITYYILALYPHDDDVKHENVKDKKHGVERAAALMKKGFTPQLFKKIKKGSTITEYEIDLHDAELKESFDRSYELQDWEDC